MTETVARFKWNSGVGKKLGLDTCLVNLSAAKFMERRGNGKIIGTVGAVSYGEMEEIQIEDKSILFQLGIREMEIDCEAAQGLSTRKAWRVNQYVPGSAFKLVCYPRSGSTWLQLMLSYLTVWQWSKGRVHAEALNMNTGPAELIRWAPHAVPHLYSKEARSTKESPFPLLPRHLYRVHRNNFTARYQKVVYMLRDGRDVMSSFFDLANKRKQPHHYNSIAEFIELDDNVPAGGWWHHVSEWLLDNQHSDMHVVRFEKLKEHPQQELMKCARFLGMKPSTQAVKKAVSLATIEKVRPIWNHNLESNFIRTGLPGTWQVTFSFNDKKTFKKYGQEALEKLGYADDAKW